MAHTDDFGAAPPDSAGHQGSFTRPPDELARIEQDAHEEPTTDQDPARPGGRGSAVWLVVWGALFLAVIALFFYALGGA